jgi:hypothetical protein
MKKKQQTNERIFHKYGELGNIEKAANGGIIGRMANSLGCVVFLSFLTFMAQSRQISG